MYFRMWKIELVSILCLIAIQDLMCNEFVSDTIITTILAKGYRKEVRPRCPGATSVNVTMDLALRQIIELNEPKQFLQTNVWLRAFWNDCRLTWNKTATGVDNLVLPTSFMWIPDITLYDNSADEGMKAAKEYRVSVTSEGDTRHQIPIVLTSLCTIDTTYFPFDKQSCPLKFGMWAHSALDVNFTNVRDDADLTSYEGHVEWNVVSMNVERNVSYFEGIPYPSLVFHLKLRRKPLFFILNLFFPCVLISMVAILGFMLPPDAGEKVNLEVTVLLSLAVFQLIVLEMMPPNSETLPFISVYFASTMVLVGLSCLMTVIVLNIHFKGSQGWPVPQIGKTIVIDGLGRLLCVRFPQKVLQKNPTNEVVQGLRFERRKTVLKPLNNISTVDSVDADTPHAPETNLLLKHFSRINASLNDMVASLGDRKSDRAMCEEWEFMARVLDRAFLLIYGSLTCLILLVFIIEFQTQ
ncbi:neuronal acetylcholine receptor subunit alpha-10-like [Haliotis asinina]|uniref:neuronal acetylcholine receptor subunit alpha-10-like n=1 Tax=Haliotis asinina TaxID=109174 RepID=UPI00353270A6